MMIKKILATFLLISLFSLSASAWCIGKRGSTCKQEGGGNNVLVALGLGSNSAEDGGDKKRRESGDKADNQGYSDYKRWAVGLMISAYAVPYQDGNQYTGVEGLSGFIEHNISEFFTIGLTHLSQNFTHLSDDFRDQDINHKHTAAYAGLRVWITNRSVVRANIGLANSEVSYQDEDLKGTTEYMSVGYEYAMDESDSSRIGYRYVSIAGKDSGKGRNIGMSAHGLTFQVLF